MKLAGWRFWAGIGVGCMALSGCGPTSAQGTLVGHYKVRGVLVENSCGQTGLPTASPLDFDVEIREDNGAHYWIPTQGLRVVASKDVRTLGTVSSSGMFRFTTTQTKVLPAAMRQLNPSDFTSQQPDFDLQKRAACALSIKQTVTGLLTRRNAADGGVVSSPSAADGGAAQGGTDLTADHTIDVTPSSGSDCNGALHDFGGDYNALPCTAHYILHGTLSTTSNAVTALPAAGAAVTPH